MLINEVNGLEYEGERMKKSIDVIKPNPHRNFDIYPIGEAQVKTLIESIEDVGMFLGLPARKVGEFYEIACGHHRLEALRRVGYTHVDLAVNEYSDEEMLKIMIRENSTQRGNENFGAVLDSVGAVLVQCVKDVYATPWGDNPKVSKSEETIKGQLESKDGIGIGWKTIKTKEPSLSENHIRAALKVFRSTDAYLKLLKKGGLPEQFWHLYEKQPITTIEAVAQFPKPAHAAVWIKVATEDIRFQDKCDIDAHAKLVADMISVAKETNDLLSVDYIRERMNSIASANLGDDSKVGYVKTVEHPQMRQTEAIKPDINSGEEKNIVPFNYFQDKEEEVKPIYERIEIKDKTFQDRADELVSKMKALTNSLEKFFNDGADDDVTLYIPNLYSIADTISEQVQRFASIHDKHKQIINM